MNLQTELSVKYKNQVALLKKNLVANCNELKFLESQDVQNESIQESTEIIVSSRINEDDYGLVFSLKIYSDNFENEFQLELDIHRGNGELLFEYKYQFKTTDEIEESDIIEAFDKKLKHAENKIVSLLKTDYQINI